MRLRPACEGSLTSFTLELDLYPLGNREPVKGAAWGLPFFSNNNGEGCKDRREGSFSEELAGLSELPFSEHNQAMAACPQHLPTSRTPQHPPTLLFHHFSFRSERMGPLYSRAPQHVHVSSQHAGSSPETLPTSLRPPPQLSRNLLPAHSASPVTTCPDSPPAWEASSGVFFLLLQNASQCIQLHQTRVHPDL